MMLDTITRNKRTIIGLLVLIATVCVLVLLAADHYRRANARAEADRIISSQQPPTRWRIHKTIATLVATKSWTRGGTKRDYQRVVQLYHIHDKMQRAMAAEYLGRYPWEPMKWPSSCQLSSDPNAGYVLQVLDDYERKSR